MGTALTGFLGGFVEAKTKFDQLDQQKAERDAQLAIHKEELKLRQQTLKGQEAHNLLLNRSLEAKLAQEIREQQGRDEFARLYGTGEGMQDPAARQAALASAFKNWPLQHALELQKQYQAQDDYTQVSQLLRQGPGMGGGTGAVPGASPAGVQVPDFGMDARVIPHPDPSQPALVMPGPSSRTGLGRPPVPLGRSENQALFEHMADQVGTNAGIRPEVIQLYKTGVMPQETRNYDNRAVSPKGAVGVSQLMPGTQQEVGVTNPYDPMQNVRGGLVYLQKMWDANGGDPAKTLAAYNAGPGAVQKYGGVPPYPETQRYVQRGTAAYQGGQPGQPGAASPQSVALNQKRALLEARLQYLQQTVQLAVRTKEMQGQVEKAIDNTRAELTQIQTQLHQGETTSIARERLDVSKQAQAETERYHGVTEARERRKEAEVPFDKDFEEYFATHHNAQRPKDALKAPGGPETVRQAREAFDAYAGERDAQKAYLKEKATQDLAIERAEAGKALTPIPGDTVKTLTANTSIYNSIGKIETILTEGTDLPKDFINQVSQDAPGIRAALQGDPKKFTGLWNQYLTKWEAAAKNDPRVNRFLSAMANMRDLVIQERSGAAVSASELERATGAFVGSLPNINQAFSLFMENLSNVKERALQVLVMHGGSVRPLSGGRAVFGGLPDEVRVKIYQNEERGKRSPSAAEVAPAVQTSTPPVAPGPSAPAGGAGAPAEMSETERELRKKYGIP